MLAVAGALDVDSDLLLGLATPFCGGMSRTSGLCGAVAGGVMGIGIALGRSGPDDPVAPSYEATQHFVTQFEAEFGSRDCTDLTGCDLSTPEGQATFREGNLRERCSVFVRRAAEITARLALQRS